MVCRIASEMTEEGDYVTILGSFTPLAYAAYMLAKLTHAPDAWLVGYNAIGMPPVELSFTGSEAAAYRGALARNSFTPNGHLVHLGTHGLLECVSSAQMDGDGAINLVGDRRLRPSEGPPARRRRRARGRPELPQGRRLLLQARRAHALREGRLRDRQAHADLARQARGRSASSPAGRCTIVTPLAVLVKDDDERPFAIESLHPGVSVDEVVAATGFALDVPADVPTTAEPTAEQIDLLRNRIDPFGTVRFDFLSGEERLAYLEEVLAQEWARAEALVRVTAVG